MWIQCWLIIKKIFWIAMVEHKESGKFRNSHNDWGCIVVNPFGLPTMNEEEYARMALAKKSFSHAWPCVHNYIYSKMTDLWGGMKQKQWPLIIVLEVNYTMVFWKNNYWYLLVCYGKAVTQVTVWQTCFVGPQLHFKHVWILHQHYSDH